jgi:hypothetical protein
MGVEFTRSKGSAASQWLLPRIVRKAPRPGFYHPAGKRQILEVLKAVGPEACYGLRLVEFVRQPRMKNSAVPIFGRYHAPGRILLYEQPYSPWRLPGLFHKNDVRRLERAGARVTVLPDPSTTLVEWPEQTLQRLMLEEVFLHELGHHVLQHEKGKRPARIAGTRDHEAFAVKFAARRRLVLLGKPKLLR